jgi:hypothetical protein
LNPNNHETQRLETQHLDHAVRTGIISAALMGVSIGILFGLTHSAQIGAALVHAIDIYGDSTLISFDPGSPMVASIVSIIPSVIGGIAGAGAPIGASTLARWLKLDAMVQLLVGLVIRHHPSVRRRGGRVGRRGWHRGRYCLSKLIPVAERHP